MQALPGSVRVGFVTSERGSKLNMWLLIKNGRLIKGLVEWREKG